MNSFLCDRDIIGKVNSKQIVCADKLFYGFQIESSKTKQSLGVRITSNTSIFEGIMNMKNNYRYGRLIQGTKFNEGIYKCKSNSKYNKEYIRKNDNSHKNNEIGTKDNETSNFKAKFKDQHQIN